LPTARGGNGLCRRGELGPATSKEVAAADAATAGR
jgi:hypothetical protein